MAEDRPVPLSAVPSRARTSRRPAADPSPPSRREPPRRLPGRAAEGEEAEVDPGHAAGSLTEADARSSGEEGVLPYIRRGNAIRINLGVVNLGDCSATVTARHFAASGQQVGSTRTLCVAAGR